MRCSVVSYTKKEPQRRRGSLCALATYDYSTDFYSRCSVSFPDHSGLAAKRQSRGSGRSIRRHGVADGFRPARIGHAFVKSDYWGSGDFYADLVDAGDHGKPACRSWNDGARRTQGPGFNRAAEGSGPGSARRSDPDTNAEAGSAASHGDADAPRRRSRQADPTGSEQAAQDAGAATAATRAQEVGAPVSMRRWRNWQTH